MRKFLRENLTSGGEGGHTQLLVHLVQLGLHHHHALPVGGVPDVRQVVDALAPLVHQQWRGLGVRRLHPVGEQVALVRLVPQVLVQVGVGDLLQRLNLQQPRAAIR